jgi:hypothetical protein
MMNSIIHHTTEQSTTTHQSRITKHYRKTLLKDTKQNKKEQKNKYIQ